MFGNADAEPRIVINGYRLSDAEAMAVRVAVCGYKGDLARENVKRANEDEPEIPTLELLHRRLAAVERVLVENPPRSVGDRLREWFGRR